MKCNPHAGIPFVAPLRGVSFVGLNRQSSLLNLMSEQEREFYAKRKK